MKCGKYKIRRLTIFTYLFFSLLCISMIYPLFCILSVSLTSAEEVSRSGFSVWPRVVDVSSYVYLAKDSQMILRAYGTTFLVAITGTVLGCIVVSLYAYTISRTSFPLRKLLSFLITFTMFFSGGMASRYIVIVSVLKLKNSIWVLILPGLLNVMNVIIMRAYFEQMPYGVAESAKIDGASEYRIFAHICFPLAKPAIATICLTLFVGYWNSYYEAMMYMDKDTWVTIQLLLQRLIQRGNFLKSMAGSGMLAQEIAELPPDSLNMAVCIITVIPMVLIFPSFQKYFVKGMAIGAVKE